MTIPRFILALSLLAAGCGSGASFATGPGGGSDHAANGSDIPPSQGGVPSASDTPPSQSDTSASASDTTGGGSGNICSFFCALLAKYPCFGGGTLPAQGCNAACQQELATNAEAAACAGPEFAALDCAEKAGALSCGDNGNLKISPAGLAACQSKLAAVPQQCTQSTSGGGGGGSCQAPDCTGCASQCDQCMCAAPDPTVCTSLCGG